MLTLVYFYIIMIVHKCQQSAAQSCSRTFELRVLPFGKTSGAKLLNFISCHLSDVFPLLEGSGKTIAFENRRGKYKEIGKKVLQAYRAYVEETFLPCDAVIARIFAKGELDEETGLYYYGARYLDPKYSRWLSGDPAVGEYIPKAPIDAEAKKHNENLPGMGGVFNTVNLQVYHYAGNNPVKYIDPDGRIAVVDDATVIVVVGAGLLLTAGVISIANNRSYKDAVSDLASQAGELGKNIIDGTIEAGKWIGEKSKEFGTWIGGKLKTAWDNIFGAKDKKHTPDQQVLNELGKEAKQNGGVSEKDAETLVNWGNEVGLPSRGPESHPNRPHGKEPHIYVGHNDHILVLPE